MCDEQLQDLEDYIQYQFDDIPSFKLALFLNSGEIKVKIAIGEVEKNLIDSLISNNLHDPPTSFYLGTYNFSQQSNSGKLLKYTTDSLSPRIYALTKDENTLIVYCCGTTLDGDEGRVVELMTDLLY
ncbi:hypothetical protein CAEBREN_12775 [Caenorhabditis brenneri]|uniref:Uncharacterized protein n=1 Tax=Caenorhabditis brenneri TaxID=135651 RepID=G0MIK7_CAEBE|nr:hypothetical protein CAEBREN_12775 [Caenorhabditis brenneri]